MDDRERAEVRTEFRRMGNMSACELGQWLESEQSREVGRRRDGGSESVGHESGCRILELKSKKVADLDDAHYAHMRKVVGYCHRHLAQRAKGDVAETRWRYSLMNWGHDPLVHSRSR